MLSQDQLDAAAELEAASRIVGNLRAEIEADAIRGTRNMRTYAELAKAHDELYIAAVALSDALKTSIPY